MPFDEATAPRGESLEPRERAVMARESAQEVHEQALSAREAAAAQREDTLRDREASARSRAELDALADQLRDANEHLVLGNVRAQMLAEKAGHLAAIVESSDDAIYSKTLDGTITSWNRGAERIYGYTAEEAIGLPVALLVPADRIPELPILLERLARGETIERLETVRVRKDGVQIDVALTISPIRDETGRIVAAAAIARDVTERRHAEAERAELLRRAREARAEAETANRLKDEFLAMVSHELRTPLNAVLGWARMVTSHRLEPSRVAHALETIERNATALALIIEDLLDVSRIVAGKMELASQPVDLVVATRDAFDVVRPLAADKGIHLAIHADPNAIAFVTGDADRLQQVISNLLTNAIKFTPAGGRVDVSIARVDGEMQVDVTDTGPGIEPAFLPHVFERFRQADAGAARRHGGLGLGLAIVRQLVESHGGTVRAASEGGGRGATFTIRLPIPAADTTAGRRPALARRHAAIAPAESGGPGDSGREAEPGGQRLDGVRVLVVDDNPDGRMLATFALTQCGAAVSAVASVGDAMRALAAERPDVIVTDLGLPDEDGYALLRHVRHEEAGQGGFTPAVALTGYGGIEHRRRVLAAGFQGHIVKPFDPADLVASIRSLTPLSSRSSSAAPSPSSPTTSSGP